MKPAIAFVLPAGLRIGGVTSWALTMAQKLTGRGQQVKLLEHNSSGAIPAGSVEDGIEIVSCPGELPLYASNRDVKAYMPSYKKLLPGTIVPNWSPGAYAACAALTTDGSDHTRLIGYAHTDHLSYYRILSYYESVISRFVAVSEEAGLKLSQHLPNRIHDIVVKPYAVESEPRLDRSYSPESRPINLLYAGRLDENQKRVSQLVDLAEILASRSTDFQLRIIGDGPVKEALARRIERTPTNVQRRIQLEEVVPHSEMSEIWRSNDVCVLVSNFEGTSISMLEAMAEGCVPVVTKVSGTSSVISDGVNGYTVDFDDLGAMASVIDDLAGDHARLKELGKNAHGTICKEYSYEQYIDWFLALFIQAIRDHLPAHFRAGTGVEIG